MEIRLIRLFTKNKEKSSLSLIKELKSGETHTWLQFSIKNIKNGMHILLMFNFKIS
jgi:hypothetical protein